MLLQCVVPHVPAGPSAALRSWLPGPPAWPAVQYTGSTHQGGTSPPVSACATPQAQGTRQLRLGVSRQPKPAVCGQRAWPGMHRMDLYACQCGPPGGTCWLATQARPHTGRGCCRPTKRSTKQHTCTVAGCAHKAPIQCPRPRPRARPQSQPANPSQSQPIPATPLTVASSLALASASAAFACVAARRGRNQGGQGHTQYQLFCGHVL